MFAGRQVFDINTDRLVTESPLPLVGQSYAAIALAPYTKEGGDDTKYNVPPQFCINILGVFGSYEDAVAYVKRISGCGFNQFDVYIAQVNKFLPLPPPKNLDTHYMQDLMDKFYKKHMDAYKEKARLFTEELEKRDKDIKEDKA